MPWSGLGITAGQPHGTWFKFNDSTHEELSAPFLPAITKFPRLRIIEDQTYGSSATANRLWALDVKNYSPTTFIHYGIANPGGSKVYLPNFIATYGPKMLAAAQWAQDNGMDEFQVGNEFEQSGELGSLALTSITRTSNVATAVAPVAHNLVTGDTINISANPSSFNVSQVACTVIDAFTFTYPNTGVDTVTTGTPTVQTGNLTIIRCVKLLASMAQAVFTRGPITYSVSQGYQQFWTSITPGVDLDSIGLDLYAANSYDNFVAMATAMFAIFGTLMYISEFNIHESWGSVSIDGRTPSMKGFDRFYAYECGRRLRFLIALGVPQAYFFSAWNASTSDNNNFTAFFNENRLTGNDDGQLIGEWKQVYDELLEIRQEHIFLGTQQHTTGGSAPGIALKMLEFRQQPRDFGKSLNFASGGIVKMDTTENPFQGYFYISLWVKWFGPNGSFQHLLSKRDSYGPTTMNMDLSINPTNDHVQLDTGNGQKDFATVLPEHRWCNVIYVHAGDPVLEEQLYLDADKMSAQGLTGAGTGTAALLSIGAAEAGAIEPFNGLIDEVVIGTVSPTWREVVAISKKYNYPGLWAQWKFDEVSGILIADSSGNNRNGVLDTATRTSDVAFKTRTA